MIETAYVLLGAFVGGLLTYLTTLRTLYNHSVISERKAWREEIRKITLEIVENVEAQDSAKLKLLRNRLALRLNPEDPLDCNILECAIFQGGDKCNHEASKCSREDFVYRISLLLKHDWERAKLETSLWRKIFLQAKRKESNPNESRLKAKNPHTFKFFPIFLAIIAALLIVPFIVESSYLHSLFESWLSGLNLVLSTFRAE